MSKRIVIVSGGELDEALTCEILGEDENSFIIGVDKGVEFLYHHQIMPSYIVGDFDSASSEIRDYYREETDVPIREYNPVKDASDTEIAIRRRDQTFEDRSLWPLLFSISAGARSVRL